MISMPKSLKTLNKAKHIARKKRGLDLAVARPVLAALCFLSVFVRYRPLNKSF